MSESWSESLKKAPPSALNVIQERLHQYSLLAEKSHQNDDNPHEHSRYRCQSERQRMICPMSKLQKSQVCLVKQHAKIVPLQVDRCKVMPQQMAATINFKVLHLETHPPLNLLRCFKPNTALSCPEHLGNQKQD